MSINQEAKLAETIERQRLLFASFIFLVGLAQAVQALQYYYDRQDYPVVNFLHNALGLAQIVAALALGAGLFQIIRRSLGLPATACRRMLTEGFVEKTLLAAFAFSWCFTFLVILLIGEWTEPDVMFYGPHDPASRFPATYYLHLIASCMTLGYSLAFFLLVRRSDDATETATA